MTSSSSSSLLSTSGDIFFSVTFFIGWSFCRYFSQYLLIRGTTVLCEVTGKRTNRGSGYGLEIPCRYTINGNKLDVRWLNELILKEATIVKDAVDKDRGKAEDQIW